MTVERVEFGGAAYEIEYDDLDRPQRVFRLNGRWMNLIWSRDEIPDREARGAVYLSQGNRYEYRNRT
jgi:hypothetical protein